MASADILDYVHEQLDAGYSRDEIRASLRSAGWDEEEIEQALPSPPSAPEIHPPVSTHPPRNKGFLLSLMAGAVLLIASFLPFFFEIIAQDISQGGLSIAILGLFSNSLPSILSAGMIVLFSVIILLGSFLMKREGTEKIGGILVIIVSVLCIIGFNGILILIGSILGVLAGLVELKRDSG